MLAHDTVHTGAHKGVCVQAIHCSCVSVHRVCFILESTVQYFITIVPFRNKIYELKFTTTFEVQSPSMIFNSVV
jgi:hypothetical protein